MSDPSSVPSAAPPPHWRGAPADGRERLGPRGDAAPTEVKFVDARANFSFVSALALGITAIVCVYLLGARHTFPDTATAVACCLLGGALLLSEHRRLARADRARVEIAAATAATRRAEDECAAQLARYRVAIDNMSQGLCMFDPAGRLIMSNRRYAELYRVAEDKLRPGMTLDEIVADRRASGNIAKMGETAYRELMREIRQRGEPAEVVVELQDGRILLLGFVPLDHGGWVATHQDITDRKLAEAKIAHLARCDALTNLPNRVSFRENLEQSLTRVARGETLAVLCLDLDRFKAINDTLGHHVGDILLQRVAERLRQCARETDTVARLSGDEFAIVQVCGEQPAAAIALAERIVQSIALPLDLDGHQVGVGASVGIAIAPGDGADPDRLMKSADMALYRAKADGRSTFRFFEPEMDARMQERRTLEADLRRALAKHEFTLHYQPIVSLKSGQITSFEALIRWNHPTRGLVAPADFIAIAEETGLIVTIGAWTIRQACLDAVAWPSHVGVAVNLSPRQLRSADLVDTVTSALRGCGLAPGRLQLEITELSVRQDSEAMLAILLRLHTLGVRISLDDFGTGYSSFSYLKKFPFDRIKIDRSFIHEVGGEHDSVAIVRAVSTLGRSLGMTTTAEGVETPEQLEAVLSEGYTEVQGYLFGRPQPAEEVAPLLAAQPSNVLAVA